MDGSCQNIGLYWILKVDFKGPIVVMFVHLRIVKPGKMGMHQNVCLHCLLTSEQKTQKKNKETATDRMLEDFEGNTLNGVIG